MRSQNQHPLSHPTLHHLQVVSIKSKYILLNDTGMGIEFKQKGTPDPEDPRYAAYGECRRFAGPLQPSERWDACTCAAVGLHCCAGACCVECCPKHGLLHAVVSPG